MNTFIPLLNIISVSCCVTIHPRRSSTADQFHSKIQRKCTWEFPYSTGKYVLLSVLNKKQNNKISCRSVSLTLACARTEWPLQLTTNTVRSRRLARTSNSGKKTARNISQVSLPNTQSPSNYSNLQSTRSYSSSSSSMTLHSNADLPSLTDFSPSALIPDFSFQLFVLPLLISVYTQFHHLFVGWSS